MRTMNRTSWVVALAMTGVVACSSSGDDSTANVPDAAMQDATTASDAATRLDTGTSDAHAASDVTTATDGAVEDASAVDASAVDASARDAGPEDAAVADTGPADATAVDASLSDASLFDATADGSPADANAEDASNSDTGAGSVTLTVLNFKNWCTVTINGGAASSAASLTAPVAPGSTATIVATPLDDSFVIGPDPWFGVTQNDGGAAPGVDNGSGTTETSTATVVVTGNQCVSVCCQFPDNTPVPCPVANPCP
jgi:hypothetical protein